MKRRNGDAVQLAGAHILVVEDEFLLLMELESILLRAGVENVYLCRNVKDALACAESQTLTLAILDVRLGPESVVPVARRLTNRATPFMFYTGHIVTDSVFAEWPACKILSKPARSQVIVQAAAGLRSRL
jgi:DNA-binding response OmpR family regulator